MVLIASAATGFAGALFNPAVRAYLAADAGQRQVEAFAVFNIFYQAGILVGPLVGLAFMAVDRLTAAAAARCSALLTIAQLFALPQHDADPDERRRCCRTGATCWLTAPFLLFAVAMIGSYVLSFQVYLALPLRRPPRTTACLDADRGYVRGVGRGGGERAVRITRWFSQRWGAQPLTGHRHDSGGAIALRR